MRPLVTRRRSIIPQHHASSSLGAGLVVLHLLAQPVEERGELGGTQIGDMQDARRPVHRTTSSPRRRSSSDIARKRARLGSTGPSASFGIAGQEQVAEALGADRTSVSNWERGLATPQPHQRSAYADILGITLTDLDAILTNITPPADRTPVWLAQYLALEQSAAEIFGHEPHVVDGLLQTPEYAAAIARSVGVVPTSESYERRNVEQRAHRQARVNNGDVVLHIVHSEIAVRLQMGSPATMAGQMDRLVEMGQRPNITIQVVPFEFGQYEALRMGSISVMTHPWVQGRTVYYLPYQGLALIEDQDEAANFIAAVEHASTVALSPDDSLAFIAQAADQWRKTDG